MTKYNYLGVLSFNSVPLWTHQSSAPQVCTIKYKYLILLSIVMDENKLHAESNELLIMEVLFEKDELRFKDLQRLTELSPPTLTKRLKVMETRGIIKKTLHPGEKWPHYALHSPEYLKEFLLPQFFWAVLDEKYPEGTSLETIAGNFGEMLLYVLFKEKTNYRNHEIAIKGLIEIMRNSVDKWVEKGINIESPDFDRYYRTFIEPKLTSKGLRRMSDEVFRKD